MAGAGDRSCATAPRRTRRYAVVHLARLLCVCFIGVVLTSHSLRLEQNQQHNMRAFTGMAGALRGVHSKAPEGLPGRRRPSNTVARQASLIEVPGGIKNGLKIMVDGDPYEILEFHAQRKGRGSAMMKTKVRNLRTGARIEKRFNSGTRLEECITESKDATFAYIDEQGLYHFLEAETFDDFIVATGTLGDKIDWITEGQEVTLQLWNDEIIDLRLVGHIELEIIETQDKSDSVTKSSIVAVLSNGASISVPFYIKVGDKVQINSHSLAFMKRLDG